MHEHLSEDFKPIHVTLLHEDNPFSLVLENSLEIPYGASAEYCEKNRITRIGEGDAVVSSVVSQPLHSTRYINCFGGFVRGYDASGKVYMGLWHCNSQKVFTDSQKLEVFTFAIRNQFIEMLQHCVRGSVDFVLFGGRDNYEGEKDLDLLKTVGNIASEKLGFSGRIVSGPDYIANKFGTSVFAGNLGDLWVCKLKQPHPMFDQAFPIGAVIAQKAQFEEFYNEDEGYAEREDVVPQTVPWLSSE